MDKDNITGWFTTEDGVHVPIHGNENKVQAMKRHFGKNTPVEAKHKENVIQTIESMNLVMSESDFYDRIGWVDLASGVHDTYKTKQIMDEYFKRD